MRGEKEYVKWDSSHVTKVHDYKERKKWERYN